MKSLRSLGIQDQQFVEIGKTRRGQKLWHLFSKDAINAVDLARAVGRPLLVRGETGIGKSQLARAVAKVLGWAYHPRVLDAQTTGRELLYDIDAVARLGQAQALGAVRQDAPDLSSLDLEKFIVPGPLWWGFDWTQAAKLRPQLAPPPPQPWGEGRGVVVLLDEIDKADPALPHALLDVLGSGGFETPLGRVPGPASAHAPPFIVITTNEERALPDAFVRRCIVLHLPWPSSPERATAWLRKVGVKQYPRTEPVIDAAIQLLLEHRRQARSQDLNPPGQAELLDLLDALDQEPSAADAEAKIRAIHRFVFDKHGLAPEET